MNTPMKRQLNILLLARALRMFIISMPVIVIYWQNYGLSMRDIFILQVVFSIAVVIFEVPSGYFSDRIGRVPAVKLGSVFSAIGFFCYWLFPGFAGFIVAELLLALGSSLLSGPIEALVNETLPEKTRSAHNRMWQSRLLIAGTLSETVAALCAGIIATTVSIETVLLVQCVIFTLAIPLAFLLHETRHTTDIPTPGLQQVIAGSIFGNRRLVALNVFAAAINAGTLCMVWFVQPHWRELGVNILYFGYLWAGLQLLRTIGAFTAEHLERRIRFRVLFTLAGMLIAGGYLALGVWSQSWIALAIAPIFWFVSGVVNPLIVHYVQQESRPEEQATTLSVNKLGSRLIFSITSPFLGWVTDVWSFATAFYTSAVIFGLVAGIGLWLLYRSYER